MGKIEFESQIVSETSIVAKLKNCVNAFGEPIYVGPNGPTDKLEEAVLIPAMPDLYKSKDTVE